MDLRSDAQKRSKTEILGDDRFLVFVDSLSNRDLKKALSLIQSSKTVIKIARYFYRHWPQHECADRFFADRLVDEVCDAVNIELGTAKKDDLERYFLFMQLQRELAEQPSTPE